MPHPYLTADAVFNDHPHTVYDDATGENMHRGHVTLDAFNQALARPASDVVDALEALPHTLRHTWIRCAAHDPAQDCDDTYCACEAAEFGMWQEQTVRGADGAIPVTVVTTVRLGDTSLYKPALAHA